MCMHDCKSIHHYPPTPSRISDWEDRRIDFFLYLLYSHIASLKTGDCMRKIALFKGRRDRGHPGGSFLTRTHPQRSSRTPPASPHVNGREHGGALGPALREGERVPM